jgi:hypothetical protein
MPGLLKLVACSMPAPAPADDDRLDLSRIAPSLRCARMVLGHLWQYLQPRSVIELGCGRGTWLKACHELGSTSVLGYDGAWNSGHLMIDSAIEFHRVDLNAPLELPPNIDMALSMQVMGQLDSAAAACFVERLSSASNVVLFNAADSAQTGERFPHGQCQSRWATLFACHGYQRFDLFRSRFWCIGDACNWYRNNTILYARSGSAQHRQLRAAGVQIGSESDE